MNKKFAKSSTLILFSLALCFAAYKYYQKYLARPYLTVIGYVNLADGIGRQSVELINALKDEVSISFIRTGGARELPHDLPKKTKGIIEGRTDRMGKVIIFEDSIWGPKTNNYQHLKTPAQEDQIRIAYSMFESTKIPNEWVYILNLYFDAVAVPDKFLIDVYKNSGVTIPIFELPLGLELDTFLNQPLKSKPHYPLVFGNLSACLDRKNQITLVRAFAKAFGNNPNVSLLINSRSGEPEAIRELTKEILDLSLDNVRFTQFSLTPKQYLETFQNIDCYVSLSKGEGFSIQPREAMALGIPVIATDNTGQSTICRSEAIQVVNSSQLAPAYYGWGGCYGHSFNCSVDEAAGALRNLYEHYDQHLSHAAAARNWVRQYEYKNLLPLYKSLVIPKKVILGEENKITPDYLMTNSKKLFTKYQQLK